MNTVNTPAGTVCPVRIGAAWARRSTGGSFGVGALGSGAGMTAILYSAALVNTRRHHRRSGARTPKSGRIARDTPRLYALYSVVFRCRMHTNSARKPYSRKGFQICIQCIQRIPTPFVFAFSLLLGREYMNTANTSGRSERRHGMIRRRWSMATAVRHRDDAPEPSPRWMRPRYPDKMAGLYSAAPVNTRRSRSGTGHERRKTPRTGRDTRLLYALYSVVFRCRMHTNSARKPYSRKGFQFCIQCIQRIPTPFVFRLSLLLEPEYMNTVNTPAGVNAVITIRPVPVRIRAARPERRCTGLRRPSASGAGGTADLYSATLVNTCGDRPRTGLRTPESAENGRDTPLLYALYSVVFRCRMHTFSA